MAAPKENLLSLGHLTCTERNTFTKKRENSLNKRAMHLKQRWLELKERELAAQQHNRQLLQQLEEAQDTLRKMLTLNTAMKTIRMEYERYLEENSPRWQQQLREKTQAAQRKRMEECLKSCQQNIEDQVKKSSVDQPLLSQGPSSKPPRISATQKHYSPRSHLDYNQDGSPHLPYMQSSLHTYPQSQSDRFPIGAPYLSQGSSHAPPSFLQPPAFSHPLQLNHLASTPGHHHLWPRQNLSDWASLQSDYPGSWTAAAAGIPSGSEALWGQLYTEEPPPERGEVQVFGVEAETSRAPSSNRERGGGSRSDHSSQELDIKPVRLSSGPAESSESSRESSQTSREKRKKREKRERSQRTSSDRERCSSKESSWTSSAILIAAVTAAQSSESDASSEKGRTSTTTKRRRNVGLAVGSPKAEKTLKERTRSNRDDSGSQKEKRPCDAEEAGDISPDDKSESCREESGSQGEEESESVRGNIKIRNGGADEVVKESSNSEDSSAGEKDDEDEHEKDLEEGDEEEDDGEEKEASQRDEEQEKKDVRDDEEAFKRKNTTKEEEEEEPEEEMEEQEPEEEMEEQEPEDEGDQEETSDRLNNEDDENGKPDSASSQGDEVDEDEYEGGEDKIEGGEEEGESDQEEKGRGEDEREQRIDEAEAEEERDSEDSIISPHTRSKKMHIIPEEASEDEDEEEEEEEEEEGSINRSGDDDVNEFSDEDIEHLLAPQEQSEKKEVKDLKADEKPKAIFDMVEIFQVEQNGSTKMDNPSDSEEFDHFYD